jgi:GNAT superfamily N-acetyltransferase
MGATLEGLMLRAYRAGDIDALKAIDVEFQRELGFGTPDRPTYEHEDLNDIPGVYLNAGGGFWVAERAGEIVGYGGVLRVDDETARLRRFRVRADWRRRGLATLLLETTEAFCRELGFRLITLGTTHLQEAAQALYRNNGYVEVGRYQYNDFLIEINFEKELR